VTDAGLKHLTALKNLRMLTLPFRTVTEDGKNELAKALPKCKIRR
jgi:hypothetical protein